MTVPRRAALLLAASLAACKTEVVCTTEQVTCDGQCISTASDPAHCGVCGRSLRRRETCSRACCSGAGCPPPSTRPASTAAPCRAPPPPRPRWVAPVAGGLGPISLAWRGETLWVANSISNTLRPDGGLTPASPPTPLPRRERPGLRVPSPTSSSSPSGTASSTCPTRRWARCSSSTRPHPPPSSPRSRSAASPSRRGSPSTGARPTSR